MIAPSRFFPAWLENAVFLIGVVIFAVPAASANSPIAVTSTGTSYRWKSFPIIYTVDGGKLGAFSNLQANQLAAEAFAAWTAVSTASLSVTQNTTIGLGSDGDVDTLAEFDQVTDVSSCITANPVIYDTNGSITDSLFGIGASASVLGFAGPCAAALDGSILVCMRL